MMALLHMPHLETSHRLLDICQFVGHSAHSVISGDAPLRHDLQPGASLQSSVQGTVQRLQPCCRYV